MPTACGTRMSENIIGGSKSIRRIGIIVTSAASDGVFTIVKKSYFFRNSRNSGNTNEEGLINEMLSIKEGGLPGRYPPAYLITQMGIRDGFCPVAT